MHLKYLAFSSAVEINMSSILSLSISKVGQLLNKQQIKAADLCRICLERIAIIKKLNAFITVSDDVAMGQAAATQKRLDQGASIGALDGIPIAIKDNFNTTNILTTCGSKILSNYAAPYNATVVQRLLDSGAVMLGKTNLDEFAMGSATVDSYFGPTKNPWRSGLKYALKTKNAESVKESVTEETNYDNVPKASLTDEDFFVSGGSSGGSAAAVATGACFGAIGSDTGGSTRSPAACCGIVGLKPTYGLVSRSGLIPLCNSLDVPGILARSVDDATLLLNCVAGFDPCDSTTIAQKFESFFIEDNIDVKDFHVGIPKEYECSHMSPEVVSTWKAVADIFAKAGAKVSTVSLPHTKYSIVCYSILCCCDVASNFARYDGVKYGYRASANATTGHHYAATRQEGLGEVVRERILAGNYYLLKQNYEKYFVKAAQVRQLICNDFQAVFNAGVDILLTPVTLTEPPPYSEWILTDNREHNAIDDYCTQPVNLAGLPAVSVPCRLSRQGLPLSLQVIGKAFCEKRMLAAAKWIERQMNFPVLDLHS